MYKMLAHWLIGRAAERGKPLPWWLRPVVDRDASLAAFESASRRLGPQLRRDAQQWIQETEEHEPAIAIRPLRTRSRTAHPRSIARRFAWPVATCAAAAALMVAIAIAMRSDDRDKIALADGAAARNEGVAAVAAADRDQFLAAWQAGQTSMVDLSQRMQRLSIQVRLPARVESAMLFSEVERAGDATERAVARWDAAAATRRQELAADVKSACRFFTRRLPTSLALVMGLDGAAENGEPTS
jgi:hypothetical protein